MGEINQAALELLQRGLSVIRLQPGLKKPAGPWERYQRETATAEEVEEWPSNSNIGIVTGPISRLLVVDFDPEKGGTKEVSDEWLSHYPTNLIVQTGTGGIHLYYQYPEGQGDIPNSASIRPGVDVRARGGMVVAPPSIHPNGNAYTWVKQGNPGRISASVVRAPRTGESSSSNHPGWVSQMLSGVSSGSRDDAAAKLAGWLHGKSMGAREAIAFLQVWNSKNKPPLPDSDIEKTVHSVYRRANRNSAETPSASAPGINPFQLSKLDDYMVTYADTDTPWIIPNWLPARTIAFAVAEPGSYKTWAVLDLCVSVASGKPFMGIYPVNEKETGPVFLIQQEDYHGQTVERLSVIVQSRFPFRAKDMGGEDVSFEMDSPPEIPILIHTERRFKFDDKQAMDDFAAAVRQHKPKLVVLDPLYSAADSGQMESHLATMVNDMVIFKNLRDECGTSFLVCHHTKKSGDKKERDRIWGSQLVNAFMETGWQMSKAKDDEKTVNFTRHFKTAANPTQVAIHFNISTVGTEYHYEPMEVEIEDDEQTDEIRLPSERTEPGNEGEKRRGGRTNKLRKSVEQYLTERAGQMFTYKYLAEQTNCHPSTLSNIFAIARAKGTLINQGNQYGFKKEPPNDF